MITDKETRDFERKIHIKYSLGEGAWMFFKCIIIYTIIVFITFMIVPKNNNFNLFAYRSEVYIVVFVIASIQAILHYRFLKRNASISNNISYIKSNSNNPLGEINKLIVYYNNELDICNKNFQLLKLFAPTPLIIYWFGIYGTSKLKIDEIVNKNIWELQISEGLLYASAIILLVYISIFIKVYFRFKIFKRGLSKYQQEEELLKSGV